MIPFFTCSKILGEAGKQEILQQMFRKFQISNRLPNRYSSENCLWVPLCLFNVGFDVWFTHVPQGKDIVYVAFPNCCSKDSCAQSCCFNICPENIGKGIKNAVFVPIEVPWFRRQCFPLKWNKFSLRINLSIAGK